MLAYEVPTIQRTMKTWMEAGLLDLVAEKIMFVQGPRDKPTSDYAKWVAFLRGLAAQYGFSVITSLSNIRFRALFNLSDACSATHFLFMEEDWVVTAEGFAGTAAIKEHVFNELSSATELLSTGWSMASGSEVCATAEILIGPSILGIIIYQNGEAAGRGQS